MTKRMSHVGLILDEMFSYGLTLGSRSESLDGYWHSESIHEILNKSACRLRPCSKHLSKGYSNCDLPKCMVDKSASERSQIRSYGVADQSSCADHALMVARELGSIQGDKQNLSIAVWLFLTVLTDNCVLRY